MLYCSVSNNAFQRQPTPIPNHGKSKDLKMETSMAGTITIREDNGAYIGVKEEEEEDHQVHTADKEDLEDMWKEMSMALECSKV